MTLCFEFINDFNQLRGRSQYSLCYMCYMCYTVLHVLNGMVRKGKGFSGQLVSSVSNYKSFPTDDIHKCLLPSGFNLTLRAVDALKALPLLR